MISKRLEDIGEVELDSLIANGVPEGKTIEYKKVLPGNFDGDKKEFLADVSSFANTAGGDLIFGIDETPVHRQQFQAFLSLIRSGSPAIGQHY